ncbi:MAG: hypothetical protein JRF64_06630, partial [Deltaproteobacteria bacterium]|nr:hypothetical protein [Deltaproteobacteria bacterium]
MVVFSRGSMVLATCGYMDDRWAQRMADRVNRTCSTAHDTAQVQTLYEAGTSKRALLYTRLIPGSKVMLTLFTLQSASLSFLNKQADLVITWLAREPKTETSSSITGFNVQMPDSQRGFIIETLDRIQGRRKKKRTLEDGPAMRRDSGKLPSREALLRNLVFLAQRLAFYILVLLGIIFLTYLGLDMARGTDLGDAASNAISDTLRYVERILSGDFGMTTIGFETLRPVPTAGVIKERLPRTLGLLGISLLVASISGILLGIRAATRRSQRSLGIIVATIVGISVPSFFAAFLLQYAVI